MPKHRNVAAAVTSARALFFVAACVALVSACSSRQHASTVPGTVPAVWTGSPAPSGTAGAEGDQQQPAAQSITTQLKAPDGVRVATAKLDFSNGYATITIATTGAGELTPGFHGVHIHQAGKCEPNSTAPTGGAPGDFLSAGGHFQAPGHSAEPASGNLTSLEVRKDGVGMLVTTTDAFTMEDLMTGEKTAIIIHAGADNFQNIPRDRYHQTNGTPGPDETTMSTNDAGKRVACGVIGAG